jgi:hypothetical protein
MTKKKEYDPKVPLFLIATAIAGGVKKRGGKLFRISVVRTAEHQYQIKYKCRARDANHRCASVILSPSPLDQPSPDEVREHD